MIQLPLHRFDTLRLGIRILPARELATTNAELTMASSRSTTTSADEAPTLIHAWPSMRSTPPIWRDSFYACSGAKLKGILDDPQEGPDGEFDEPDDEPQVRRVEQSRVDLITITIGGNDIGFADVLKACIGPLGTVPCQFTDFLDGDSTTTQSVESWVNEQINQLYSRLITELPDLVRRAGTNDPAHPPALAVLGYPRLFGEVDQACVVRKFGPIDFGFTALEVEFLNSTADRLNRALACAARSTGAYFIDVAPGFVGRNLCSDGTSLINGLTLINDRHESFHPNREGHVRMAGIVDSYFQRVVGDDVLHGSPPVVGGLNCGEFQ